MTVGAYHGQREVSLESFGTVQIPLLLSSALRDLSHLCRHIDQIWHPAGVSTSLYLMRRDVIPSARSPTVLDDGQTTRYSRTPLIRPPSESHWCGRIRGMVAREGFVYEQKPLSVTRNVVVWEGWSLVRVVVRQGFYCTAIVSRPITVCQDMMGYWP